MRGQREKNIRLELILPAQYASELMANISIETFWSKFRSSMPLKGQTYELFKKHLFGLICTMYKSISLYPGELGMTWQPATYHQGDC